MKLEETICEIKIALLKLELPLKDWETDFDKKEIIERLIGILKDYNKDYNKDFMTDFDELGE